MYINGIGVVSPIKSFLETEINQVENSYLKSFEPNYKEQINPVLLRRMSRIIKMGVYSAKMCLADANVENPDAIITGTAMGCIEDTEKFLISMIENDEELLTPTSFIQSTHNTVSSQIALLIKCNAYNFTYVHRGYSFESSLFDAIMQFAENQIETALIGGIDEITDNHYRITSKNNWWKNNVSIRDIFTSNTCGAIAGEGSSFILLDIKKNENTYCKLLGLKTFNSVESPDLTSIVNEFLSSYKLSINEIDSIVIGKSGDNRFDESYNEFADLFDNVNITTFKNLCGEYYTVSAFATALAAFSIKNNSFPNASIFRRNNKKRIEKVLIYNNFQNANHSLILLSNV